MGVRTHTQGLKAQATKATSILQFASPQLIHAVGLKPVTVGSLSGAWGCPSEEQGKAGQEPEKPTEQTNQPFRNKSDLAS